MNKNEAVRKARTDYAHARQRLVNGTGSQAQYEAAKAALDAAKAVDECPDCHGHGERLERGPLNDPEGEALVRCERCHGTGEIEAEEA